MSELLEYVREHTERGECKCGKCIDVGNRPDPVPSDTEEWKDPASLIRNLSNTHTADLVFFKCVTRNDPDRDELLSLVKEHSAEFGDGIDPFDGEEHNCLEIGGWIGDQGGAMQFMALASLLWLCTLLTPAILTIPASLQQQLAGAGMISIKAT